MIMRLRRLLAVATFLFLFLTIAAASGDPNVSIALSNVSRPYSNSTTLGALVHNVTYGGHSHPYDIVSTASLSDLVQAADSRWPEEEKMKAIKWQGKATLEVNMFSDTVNTCGNVTSSALYNAIWQNLNNQCPSKIGNNDLPPCWDDKVPIPIRYKWKEGHWEDKSNCQLRVISSNFANPAAREAMFGALAATYEAMTANDMNCYTVKDPEFNGRYCNVAAQASVFTEDSHIYMSLISDWSQHQAAYDRAGDWKCCETREYVDSKLDTGNVEQFKEIYPKPCSKLRNVECHRGCREDQRMTREDVDLRLIHVMDYEKF